MQRLFTILFISFCTLIATAQNFSFQQSVTLSAVLNEKDPSITIKWPLDPDAKNYTIYRKNKNALAWGTSLAVYPKDSFKFTDRNIEVGKTYEYRVTRTHVSTSSIGSGFIFSGIKNPATYQRASILLLVDKRFATSLTAEIDVLKNDLIQEGWNPIITYVADSMKAPLVKGEIRNVRIQNPDLKSIIIIGHVAVPYSGETNYDGHGDHIGAWPSDSYYADYDTQWTDNTVDNVSAGRTENKNIPGDGKFDQSAIPSDIDFEVGRIDFFNMPAFPISELQLLKNYFKKNHNFRVANFKANRKGLVQDNFNYAEGFGQSGVKNFSSFFGPNNVVSGEYRNTLLAESYLWSYGAGGGWYEGAGGISTTQDMAKDSLQTVFTFLFGSYFGDWDSPNNFLRSALGSGTILTAAWAGRPVWAVHHMGLGETIGFGARFSQNNTSTYVPQGYGNRGSHSSLMGDPSLVLFPIKPASNLKATAAADGVSLTWDPSADATEGYSIFRKKKNEKYFSLLSERVTALTYKDPCNAFDTLYEYMVRAVKLESTASGTYYNPSPGIRVSVKSISNTIPKAVMTLQNDFEFITGTSQSINASKVTWLLDKMKNISNDSILNYRLDCLNKEADISLVAHGVCRNDTVTTAMNYNCSEPQSGGAELDDIKCHGGTAGLTIFRFIGAEPFKYLWNTGDTTISIQKPLIAGTYTLTVTSRLKTSRIYSWTFTEPDSLLVTITVTDAKVSAPGKANLTITGGTAPYSYKLSNGGKIDSLAPGDYTVIVTDANGCMLTKNFKVNLNVANQDYNPINVNLYPNPARDFIIINWAENIPELTVSILDVSGRLIITHPSIRNGDRISTKELPAGNYNLQFGSEDLQFFRSFSKQ